MAETLADIFVTSVAAGGLAAGTSGALGTLNVGRTVPPELQLGTFAVLVNANTPTAEVLEVVGGLSGTGWTVVRASEPVDIGGVRTQTAFNHNAGEPVQMVVTAQALASFVRSQQTVVRPASPPASVDALYISQGRNGRLGSYTGWLTARGVPTKGIIGEMGVPVSKSGNDIQRWSALLEAYLNDCDAANLDVFLWAATDNNYGGNDNAYPSTTPATPSPVGTAAAALPYSPLGGRVNPNGIVLENHLFVPNSNPARVRGIAMAQSQNGAFQSAGASGGFSNVRESVAPGGSGLTYTFSTTGFWDPPEFNFPYYNYGRLQDYQTLAARGIGYVRLPVRWERIQRTLGGALDTVELARLDTAITFAAQCGIRIILDCHNFGLYCLDDGTQGQAQPISSKTAIGVAPAAPGLAASGAGSTLTAQAYTYEIAWWQQIGHTSGNRIGVTAVSPTAALTPTAGQNIVLTPPASPPAGAQGYIVFGRIAGNLQQLAIVTGFGTWTDTGAAALGGTANLWTTDHSAPLVTVANHTDLWTKLSAHYKNFPGIYGYEFMNEPFAMTAGDVELISKNAAVAVRTTNGDTAPVLWCPLGGNGDYSSPDNTGSHTTDFMAASDTTGNYRYVVHHYFDRLSGYSSGYTHTYAQELSDAQGAGWMGPGDEKRVVAGTGSTFITQTQATSTGNPTLVSGGSGGNAWTPSIQFIIPPSGLVELDLDAIFSIVGTAGDLAFFGFAETQIQGGAWANLQGTVTARTLMACQVTDAVTRYYAVKKTFILNGVVGGTYTCQLAMQTGNARTTVGFSWGSGNYGHVKMRAL